MIFELNKDGQFSLMSKVDFHKTAGLSVALGCFDGVHRGHCALINHATAQKNLLPAVWTFSSPLVLPFIYTVEERLSIFGKHGAKFAICEDFELIRSFTPEQFLKHMTESYNVKHMVCGEDFRFGINRIGDAQMLKTCAIKYGASTEIVTPVMNEGEKISSTLIRGLLRSGNIEKVNELLGRPFSVTGKVLHGKQIGRTMNIPTVNQKTESGRVELKHGVYYTVTVTGGKIYPSVTNVGMRPTVNEDTGDITYETHIIGEDINLYKKEITVEFYRYAREEVKFSTLSELKETIDTDIKRAADYFEHTVKIQ